MLRSATCGPARGPAHALRLDANGAFPSTDVPVLGEAPPWHDA